MPRPVANRDDRQPPGTSTNTPHYRGQSRARLGAVQRNRRGYREFEKIAGADQRHRKAVGLGFAVVEGRNFGQGVERLPGDALRIGDPVFIGTRISSRLPLGSYCR
jgi:hypothetical protein